MGTNVEEDFFRLHGSEMADFIYEAIQHGYGSRTEDTGDDNSVDGGTTIEYVRGDWRYLDEFDGGEPFSGRTRVFYKGVACWNMVYYGSVLPDYDKRTVYKCLMPALLAAPERFPLRGPSSFTSDNGLKYVNIWFGDLQQFEGVECIKDMSEDDCYVASYMGGVVNLV